MIAVDTSALMAILAKEPKGPLCLDRLNAEEEIVISAGTVAEALIVAGQRNILGRYVDEFTFRLNDGNVKRHTMQRLDSLAWSTVGRRITYRELTA